MNPITMIRRQLRPQPISAYRQANCLPCAAGIPNRVAGDHCWRDTNAQPPRDVGERGPTNSVRPGSEAEHKALVVGNWAWWTGGVATVSDRTSHSCQCPPRSRPADFKFASVPASCTPDLHGKSALPGLSRRPASRRSGEKPEASAFG